MNKEFNEDEINISDEELNGVFNALDALGTHNNQATTTEWNEIMEETNKEVKKQTSRTRMYAIAASILLVAAIGGTVFAVASNGGSKALKTVDDKDKTPVTKPNQETSTTIALTKEQQMLADTIVTKFNGDRLELFDGATNTKLKDLPNVYSPTVEYVGANNMRLLSGASPSCDEYGTDYINIKTLKEFKGQGPVGSGRYYSPSGNKYAEFLTECSFEDPNSAPTTTMTIVDTKTGEKRTIKPETVNDFAAPEGQVAKVSAVAIKWINDSTFLLGTSINYANGLDWSLESSDGTISLNTAIEKESNAVTSSDLTIIAHDVIEVDAKYYLLSSEQKENNSTLSVMNLNSGEIIWTKDISSNEISTLSGRSHLVFGKDIYRIYGSVDNSDHLTGFAFYQKLDSYILPSDTSTILPIK